MSSFMLIWRQFKPPLSLVPAPALYRQEHKHRNGSARMAQPIRAVRTSSLLRNNFKSFKNHFKLFWTDTLLDFFSDSLMKRQLEKSLLLEALTPLSSVHQCGSSPSHIKALQTNPNSPKPWLQAMPSYPNRYHCFGGLYKKQLLPTTSLWHF